MAKLANPERNNPEDIREKIDYLILHLCSKAECILVNHEPAVVGQSVEHFGNAINKLVEAKVKLSTTTTLDGLTNSVISKITEALEEEIY